jgi:ParB family transcriptional regulator, chromosome partitioning protein
MTTPPSPQALREARVLRLLHDGSSMSQAAEATGMPVDLVRALAADAAAVRRPNAAAPILELPLRVLAEHPDNVRSDLGDLTELVASVQAQGILQPLLVTRGNAGQYVVIGGHRRLAAAAQAGLTRVPVMLRSNLTGTDAVEAMLVENLQRAALDPIDEAMAYRQLLEAGRTQTDIAAAVGKAQGHISQRLALLHLTPAEQQAIRRKEVTVAAGYLAGRERSDRRMTGPQHRPKPKRVPHFTKAHPLAQAVAAACGHETTLKLGTGCGPCWEQAIRDDERARTAAGAA